MRGKLGKTSGSRKAEVSRFTGALGFASIVIVVCVFSQSMFDDRCSSEVVKLSDCLVLDLSALPDSIQ